MPSERVRRTARSRLDLAARRRRARRQRSADSVSSDDSDVVGIAAQRTSAYDGHEPCRVTRRGHPQPRPRPGSLRASTAASARLAAVELARATHGVRAPRPARRAGESQPARPELQRRDRLALSGGSWCWRVALVLLVGSGAATSAPAGLPVGADPHASRDVGEQVGGRQRHGSGSSWPGSVGVVVADLQSRCHCGHRCRRGWRGGCAVTALKPRVADSASWRVSICGYSPARLRR